MQLSFTTLKDDGDFELYTYSLPKHLTDLVSTTFNLDKENNYVLAMPNFYDYDDTYYKPIIEYFINDLSQDLEKIILGEDEKNYEVTYNLKNDISDRFEIDQLLFLTAILHNLDLKPELIVIIKILMNKHNMNFKDIKEICKSETLRISIYEKMD